MSLSKEEVLHIAKLARLTLTDAELEKYARQLSGILEYVDKLKEVDVAGVEPTAQVTGLDNVWRNDAVVGCDDETRSKIVENFPEKEGDLLKVKAVF